MSDLLDAGRKFSFAKRGLPDDKATEELTELLESFPSPAVAMGIDKKISLEYEWWISAFEKAARVFTMASLEDYRLPSWTDPPFPMLPFPEEFLPFSEIDPGLPEVHSSASPIGELPSNESPPVHPDSLSSPVREKTPSPTSDHSSIEANVLVILASDIPKDSSLP